jgi:hypothetical protein
MRALSAAWQLAEVAGDWSLDEVEIDGEMMSIYDLQHLFTAAKIEFAELSQPEAQPRPQALPTWTFYPGQEPPTIGDVFVVTEVAPMLDMQGGRVTCVTMEQPAAQGVETWVWQPIEDGQYLTDDPNGPFWIEHNGDMKICPAIGWPKFDEMPNLLEPGMAICRRIRVRKADADVLYDAVMIAHGMAIGLRVESDAEMRKRIGEVLGKAIAACKERTSVKAAGDSQRTGEGG